MDVLNHYIVHLELIERCMLTRIKLKTKTKPSKILASLKKLKI